MVVGSDAPTENPRVQETAHAPLRGASPSHIESASELEELPTATDCTTLALVDDAQSNLASLLAENQDCGVESRDCHKGTCPAALPAEIEKPLTSAIANQTPELVEQGYSATFTAENSVSGVEIKAVDEGESSATPVPNTEKWSHEAIVARSNLRPGRMQKLKVAANSGENPGFDFLQECWDDPALVVVIKKLVAKFPQWRIACVDGVLVKWNQ